MSQQRLMRKEQTRVSQACVTEALYRATFLATTALILFFLCMVFLPATILAHFGFFVFLVGLLVIAVGFIPYKKLRQLQLHPLILESSNTHITICSGDEPILTVKKAGVSSKEHISRNGCFGLQIAVTEEDCRIHNNRKAKRYYIKAKKSPKLLLFFFPFFQEKALTLL